MHCTFYDWLWDNWIPIYKWWYNKTVLSNSEVCSLPMAVATWTEFSDFVHQFLTLETSIGKEANKGQVGEVGCLHIGSCKQLV